MSKENTSFYKASANVEAIDASLRQYLQNVFLYMAVGLGFTGLVAYFAGSSYSLMSTLFSTPGLMLGLVLVELGLVFYLSARITSMDTQQAKILFYAYSVVNGLTLAPLFVVYTGASIATTFFVTAAMFLSMAIYGYVTDTDLTTMGGFMVMGVVGIIIASLVNIFLHSSALSFAISAVGVVLFTGLTAYDMQKIKSMYFEGDTEAISSKKAILGALCLYLDFINLFISLLKFLGVRRDS